MVRVAEFVLNTKQSAANVVKISRNFKIRSRGEFHHLFWGESCSAEPSQYSIEPIHHTAVGEKGEETRNRRFQ